MKSVNVLEAKTHLSRLIQEAARGETIVVAKAGKPTAMLVAYEPSVEPRKPGAWSEKVSISPSFEAPVPQVESLFAGSFQDDLPLR